jgi:hypothetical protein
MGDFQIVNRVNGRMRLFHKARDDSCERGLAQSWSSCPVDLSLVNLLPFQLG